jgi:hypothetical protein
MVGVMTRLKTLLGRYVQARADVDASNAEIRRASAKRLAELLASADRNALVAGVSDPALAAGDRLQLERAIADRLPSRRQRAPAAIGRAINLSLRQGRYHLRAIAFLAILVSPMATVGSLAWRNTATQEAFFTQAWDFVCHFPDGHRETIEIAAGAGVVAMPGSRADRVLLRIWNARAGYGLTEVPASWLRRNARVWNGRSEDGR